MQVFLQLIIQESTPFRDVFENYVVVVVATSWHRSINILSTQRARFGFQFCFGFSCIVGVADFKADTSLLWC